MESRLNAFGARCRGVEASRELVEQEVVGVIVRQRPRGADAVFEAHSLVTDHKHGVGRGPVRKEKSPNSDISGGGVAS